MALTDKIAIDSLVNVQPGYWSTGILLGHWMVAYLARAFAEATGAGHRRDGGVDRNPLA